MYIPNNPEFDCMFNPEIELELTITIPPITVLLSIIGTIVYFWRKSIHTIDLPNKWFWDPTRIRDYNKTKSDPITFYKAVKFDSEEQKYLDSLMVKLDFGSLEILTSYAIVSKILATNFYHTRQIQIHRMTNSPDQFYRDCWMYRHYELRQETLNYFLSKANKWIWNSNMTLDQSLILPVIYATDKDTAWEIAVQGFSTQIVDGPYGRGIYFTTHARRRFGNLVQMDHPSIIICLSIPGNPYPITKTKNSGLYVKNSSIKPGYQSNYVVGIYSFIQSTCLIYFFQGCDKIRITIHTRRL